jgi:hypothetical protein
VLGGMIAYMQDSKDFDEDEDFYEEDKPLEKITAAFASGLKGVTRRPTVVELSGPAQALPNSRTCPAHVTMQGAAATPILVPVGH